MQIIGNNVKTTVEVKILKNTCHPGGSVQNRSQENATMPTCSMCGVCGKVIRPESVA